MKRCLFLTTWLSIALTANPSSPTVISGAADFLTLNDRLIVHSSSDRTIIDWDSFSIDQGEITAFIQPQISSAVLNRVTSASVSDLVGELRSNGEIFLINPNGIMIQNGALVDVAAFIASSLDVMNAEFLANQEMTFSGASTASVQNDGTIEGDGGVFILGRHIVNTGDILAGRGQLGLGAADSVLLLADKAGIMINVSVGTPSGTGVIQSGRVQGNQVSIQANGNLYSLAIHHPGWAIALTTTENEGEVVFLADSGQVLLDGEGQLLARGSNGHGGLIAIQGETVTLSDQVGLNVSDLLGGGTVYIGGSAGANPTILDALTTTVGSNVTITADAILDGDGGDVVLFALGIADFAGSISATGGSAIGNGGTVEVSGLGNLIFTGQVTTTANNGNTGTLIIDPTDIVISNGVTAKSAFDRGSPPNTFSGTGAAATLNITDLNAALNSNNVVVTTTSAFEGVGDIIWSTTTPLTLTSSNNLTLLATNNINFTTAFSIKDAASGTSELTFNAGGDITVSKAVTANNLCAVNMIAGNDVLLDNAINVSGAALTITASTDIVSRGAAGNSVLTDVCVFKAGGDIILTNELNSTGDNGSASTLTWTAGNEITIINAIDFNNWDTATLKTTSGDIVIDNAVNANAVGTLTFNSGRDILNQGGTNLLNGAAINVADLVLNAARDFVIAPQIGINHFNSAVNVTGNAKAVESDN